MTFTLRRLVKWLDLIVVDWSLAEIESHAIDAKLDSLCIIDNSQLKAKFRSMQLNRECNVFRDQL